MRFGPTPSGGRVVQGSTPWGDFRVEWSADGELIEHEINPRTPARSAKDEALLAARRAICATCDQNEGLGLATVKCRGCGCSGLSLMGNADWCKLGKWSNA